MFVCKLLPITSLFIFGFGHITENNLDTITRHEFLRSDFSVKVNILQKHINFSNAINLVVALQFYIYSQ